MIEQTELPPLPEVTCMYRVSELDGALLDAAVAKAAGLNFAVESWMTMPIRPAACWLRLPDGRPNFMGGPFSPSENWYQGGPIIELELIEITGIEPGRWMATPNRPPDLRADGGHDHLQANGPTPLIAAMRAYCAVKFGDEVELP